MLGFMATDAVIAPGAAAAAAERGRRPQLQPHHHRRRHLHQRLLHADGHAARRPRADHRARLAPRAAPCATPWWPCRSSSRRPSCATAKAPPSSSPCRCEGGRNEAECRLAAYAIAHSPLVKTAFFASDPNLGRILAAVGYAGIDDLDQSLIDLLPGRRARGARRRPPPRLPRGRRPARDEAERDHRARAPAPRRRPQATVWTCDLSHDYVSINADYRS